MRLTFKDGLATVFVGCAVAVYGFWMTDGEVLGLTTTRAVSAVVLILGIAGCTTARSFFEGIYGAEEGVRPPMPYVIGVSAVGILALGSAVVALIGGSTSALTTLIIAMIILWVMATGHHLSMARRHDLAAVG